MLEYFHSFLYGKCVSYYVNALYDEKLAQDLILFAKGKRISIKGDQYERRFKRFIAYAEGGTSREKTLLVAFCLLYANGLMNYWYSHFWNNLTKSSLILERIDSYEKILVAYGAWKPWIMLTKKDISIIEKYANSQGFKNIKFTRNMVSSAVCFVQEENIYFNKETYKGIKNKKLSKERVDTIYSYLGNKSVIKSVFLKSAASTQKMAIFWDTIFVFLVR